MAPETKPSRLEWEFHSNDASEGLKARHAFLAFLFSSCKPASDCYGAQLIYGELVSNVIRHAPGPISIEVRSEASGTLTLEILDSGEGFRLEPSLPHASSELGRGLYIVSQLGSHLSVTHFGHGTKVRVELPVRTESLP